MQIKIIVKNYYCQTNGMSRLESSEIRQITQVFFMCLSIAFPIYKTVLNGLCKNGQQLNVFFFFIIKPCVMRLCENQLYGLVMELRRGRSDRNHVTFKRSDTLAHNIVKVA